MMCIIITVFLLPGLSACADEIGDIDLDDSITASDALQVLRYSVDLDEYTPELKELADVDSDGDITAADALEILRYSVGLDAADSIGQPVESENDTDTSSDTETPTRKKTLVAYFSRTGNTERIAHYIAEITGADIYAIEAVIPYSDEDIEYTTDCRANREQNDKSVRPEIKDPLESIDDYDVICLGYPIWWGEEPRIIDTFLESYDFSDKTVISFCTSGSSGIGTSEGNISKLVPIGEQLSGRRFSASSTKDDVSAWIDSLEIPKADTSADQNIQTETENDDTMTISAAEKDFCVTLENTETVTALKRILPLTLDMSELNGNEKYCYLGTKLPSDPQKIDSIKAGDVMLYGDSCLVVFYKSFDTSYSYTKIGHIDDTSGLVQSLGSSSVTVTLRAMNASNGKFDIDSRTVLLNSGYEMPILGLGTWTQDDDTAENSVYTALKDGYRLIDTAQYYGNETGVGKGLKRAISEGIVSR